MPCTNCCFWLLPTLLQYVVKDKAAADQLAKQLVFTQLSK